MPLATWQLGKVGEETVTESHQPQPYKRPVTGIGGGYQSGRRVSDFGATLVESNREDAHVHLQVEYPSTVAISAMVNALKGASSRRQHQQFKMRTQVDNLLSPYYLAAWAPRPPLPITRQYIEAQRQPT
jgi:putative transposase